MNDVVEVLVQRSKRRGGPDEHTLVFMFTRNSPDEDDCDNFVVDGIHEFHEMQVIKVRKGRDISDGQEETFYLWHLVEEDKKDEV